MSELVAASSTERDLTAAWLARDHATLAGVLARATDVVAERGEGSWLIDVDGRRFLDLGSGIAVNNLGHCHPDVVAAVQRQAAQLLHVSVTTHHPRVVELAEGLARLMPFFHEPRFFFANSGAEVVDGAVKLARRATGRPGVVAFRRGFHGRTLAATSLTTAKGVYREGYEPLLPAVHIAPYPIPLHHGGTEAAAVRALEGLDEVLAAQAPAGAVAAMVVEPVLGEGGYVVPPREWLAGLRDRCDDHGALLVFDEVQTGMGRTGRPFAAETFGVRPDVLVFAKAVASGLPLAGIAAERTLMDRWPTGAHGSTFGGNPVACAAAIATINVLERDDLCARARDLGERARVELRRLTAGMAAVLDVRGVGLMIGVELRHRHDAERVQREALAGGVLVLRCGPHENILRLVPPLTITTAELDHGLTVVGAAIGRLE